MKWKTLYFRVYLLLMCQMLNNPSQQIHITMVIALCLSCILAAYVLTFIFQRWFRFRIANRLILWNIFSLLHAMFLFVMFDLCIIVCCLVGALSFFIYSMVLFCFVGGSEKKWIFSSKMFIRASDKIECSVVDLFNLFFIRVFFFFAFVQCWAFCLSFWIFFSHLAFVVRGDDDVAVKRVFSMIP